MKNRTLRLLAICTLAVAIAGCQTRSEISPVSCSNIPSIGSVKYSCEKADLDDCIAKAEVGDVDAMEKLGLIYGGNRNGNDGAYYPRCSIHYSDGQKAIKWLKAASDNGSSALRHENTR